MKHLQENPVPPRHHEPSVPPEVERLTLTLLRKRPQDRYASAQALASEIERFLDEEGPPFTRAGAAPVPLPASEGPRRLPRPERTRRCRRRGLVAALALTLVVSRRRHRLSRRRGARVALIDALRRVAGGGHPSRFDADLHAAVTAALLECPPAVAAHAAAAVLNSYLTYLLSEGTLLHCMSLFCARRGYTKSYPALAVLDEVAA